MKPCHNRQLELSTPPRVFDEGWRLGIEPPYADVLVEPAQLTAVSGRQRDAYGWAGLG